MKKYVRVKEDKYDICALEECNKRFLKTSHNKRYCKPAHCRVATNRKILAKYHENKQPVGKGRICKARDCKTVLSSYNRDKYCNPCKGKRGMV